MIDPIDLMERAAKALKVFTGHDSYPNLKHHYGEKWWEPMDKLRLELVAAVAAKAPGWRCFHCDEVFTDERCARDHFGRDETCEPACKIKMGAERSLLTALRRAENDAADAWAAIHSESTDAAKAYHAQHARHQEQLRIAEELGFERGLAAAREEA